MFKITFSTEIQIYRFVFKCEVGQKRGAKGGGGLSVQETSLGTWNVAARIKS